MNRQIYALVICVLFLTKHVQPASISLNELRHNQENGLQPRSDGEFGFQSLFQLGIKVLPLILNLVSGGQTSSDRIEDIDLKDEDPLSWQNVLSTGIKVLLAIFSGASDGIDKSDTTPTQAVLGTLISALTGSDDPQEVATMAKQANEVISLVMTLVEALQTSFSS